MNTLKSMLVVALGLATVSAFPGQAQARSLYGSANVQSVVMTNFSTRQAQLRSAIASDVSSGTLSPYDANSLTSELDSINAQEQQALAMGGLNDFTISQLNNLFTDVTSKLDAANANAYANSQLAAYAAPVCAVPAPAPGPYYGPGSNWWHQSHDRDVARQLERSRDAVRVAQLQRNEAVRVAQLHRDEAVRVAQLQRDQSRNRVAQANIQREQQIRNARVNFENARNQEHRRF